MPVKRIVKLDTGALAAGAFTDITYSPEINLMITKIVIIEAAGNPVNNVTLTFYVADVPYFHPDVSAALFTTTSLHNPELKVLLQAGVRLSMRITNGESTTRRLYIHLIAE